MNHKTSKLKLLLITAFLLFAIIASAAIINVQAYNLPDIGSSAELTISRQDEKLLGEYIFQDVQKQLPIVANPFLEDYIQTLGNKLLKNSNSHYDKFKFFIINSSIINAFALPGGYIGINKGLITAADSEDEIAAVLAHEITHVNQRHIARSFEKQQQIHLPMIAGMLAGALLAAYSPELGQAIIAGSMAASNQSILNYTRSNESEADRLGIYTLVNSGYSPNSMADFFNKLQKHSYADKDLFPEYLRTHPVTSNRIADARNRADKIEFDQSKYPRDINFNLVKNILTTDSAQNLLQITSDNLTAGKNTKFKEEEISLHKFNTAYALLKQHKYKQSNDILIGLHKLYPKNNIIASLLAESYKSSPKKSLEILDKQLKLDQNNIPLSIQYTKTAISIKQTDKAVSMLKKITKNHEDYDPEIDLLLAKSYNNLGKKWHASISFANYSTKKGDLQAALMQLKATEKFDDLSDYQRKIINFKIKDLKSKYQTRKEKLKQWL